MNILLTGRPGCGKTTLIEKVAARLGAAAGGFFTREIRDARGLRLGFEIVTLGGPAGILAHVDIASRVRVGRYGVDVKALEQVGVRALREALEHKRVVVIDEIGKMELASDAFRRVVIEALDSECPVLASIHAYRHPFTDAIKARPDVRLVEVTPANRNWLADTILQMLEAAGTSGAH